MRWEITHPVKPEPGEIRFKTRFAWLPTTVLSKITYTDHVIWLELYVEEQEYVASLGFDGNIVHTWHTVSKTIHT